MYTDNDILFSPETIPHIRNSRGPQWKELIDRVDCLPQDHTESLAFSLSMIRLNGCMECETDSYRAMRGCTPCVLQGLRRFKSPDTKLIEMYDLALEDMRGYLATHKLHLTGEQEITHARAA